MSAIVRVGAGRGFVITAAHCLPGAPTGYSIGHTWERTYFALLGPLGEEPSVAAECVFVDPIADIAVLEHPDNQSFFEEADAYEQLVEGLTPFAVATADNGPARVFSLEGEWLQFELEVAPRGARIWLTGDGRITGGMSGSPIVDDRGRAVGVVVSDPHSPHPSLAASLPGWLLKSIGIM